MKNNYEEIKPCPFCGNVKNLVITEFNSAVKYYRISCKNNKMKHDWGWPHVQGPLAETSEQAIAAWNKRQGDEV